eukprot:Em0027g70a
MLEGIRRDQVGTAEEIRWAQQRRSGGHSRRDQVGTAKEIRWAQQRTSGGHSKGDQVGTAKDIRWAKQRRSGGHSRGDQVGTAKDIRWAQQRTSGGQSRGDQVGTAEEIRCHGDWQGAKYPQADANVREQRFQARVMQLVQQLQRGHLYVSKIGMLPSIAGSALLADCSLVSAGAGQLLKASSPLCTVSTKRRPYHLFGSFSSRWGISVPSLASVKAFKLPNIVTPVKHLSSNGLPFYSIPLQSIIAQCLSRTDVSHSLIRYQVQGQNTYTEMYHGSVWNTDTHFLAPMVKLSNGKSIFLRDCVYLNLAELGSVVGVVVKFFQEASSSCCDVFAEIEVLLDLKQFQIMVPTTTITHLSSDSLIMYDTISVPVSSIVGLAPPPCHIIRLVSSGSGFARMDLETTRSENPDIVCALRSKEEALQQMAVIKSQRTEQEKIEMRKSFGLREDENPLLHVSIPADLYQYVCIPVEILHTKLLGTCKHILQNIMPEFSPKIRKEILARIKAFNTSDFSTKLYEEWNKVCIEFVQAVKRNMPALLLKQKTHLILHLVSSMMKFGPSSSFSAESIYATCVMVKVKGIKVLMSSVRVAACFYWKTCNQLLQCGIPYNIMLGSVRLTDQVIEHHAIMSQQKCLVNSGDYLELGTPQCDMLYGILLAVFKLQDGAVVCLIQGFQKLQSQDGARPFVNEYDCPLLELTRTIFSTPGRNILRAVSVVHECGAIAVALRKLRQLRTLNGKKLLGQNLLLNMTGATLVFLQCLLCTLIRQEW